MGPVIKPHDPQTDVTRPSRDEIQREEAQEAAWNSYEHGAPETGPGDQLEIDNLETDPDGTSRRD
jgi:hypothetical protein